MKQSKVKRICKKFDKYKFHCLKNRILIDDVDIDKCWYLTRFLLVKKVADTLLVKKMMITKLFFCV